MGICRCKAQGAGRRAERKRQKLKVSIVRNENIPPFRGAGGQTQKEENTIWGVVKVKV